ncbi:hypothetical protein U1Q18_052078, partial [Sarracenia purpurea var. burkii]
MKLLSSNDVWKQHEKDECSSSSTATTRLRFITLDTDSVVVIIGNEIPSRNEACAMVILMGKRVVAIIDVESKTREKTYTVRLVAHLWHGIAIPSGQCNTR